ncbi:hypothetical protein NUU61_004875 [Penicillium alfredii]|uniref:Uncharacterized protein n=1 Tax=Penicillium alfredii TaxID=1506179 RepID=A0A9W9K735_9EURO|nr:uncharacterized protein NUU61_004875 [Penicillium alfredii]KAJ5095519.1 hypothetical protein NUU61_004875 [Penicillium alfredii]
MPRSPSPSASADRRSRRSHHGHSHSHRHRHRSRSRSPHRSDRHRSDRHHRRHDRHRDGDRHGRELPAQPVVLPFQAQELSRRDLEAYEPMFAMYLDIQKGLFIEDLNEEEVKGRWKSFVRKWNRGELAEGWYDPSTLHKARDNAAQEQLAGPIRGRESPDYTQGRQFASEDARGSPPGDEDEDDEYGPTLPHPVLTRGAPHSGPTIPNLQDLELKRGKSKLLESIHPRPTAYIPTESAIEDAIAAREDAQQERRSELRSHKAEMRHLEDEISPRAEPGTRERQLEKRREAAAANRSFAESRRGGSPTDAAPEEELMGAGDDLSAFKKEKERDQRKKNEREIRREEILRARAAEREERVRNYRQKEDETIGWLQALAKQRFG